jgi:hypothetical protein
VNDTDLDELLADTLHRHAARALPLPGDPAVWVARRAARRRRRIVAAVAAPVAAAAAFAGFALLGSFHTAAVLPVPPATHAPTPTASAAIPQPTNPVPEETGHSSDEPSVVRHVPAAGLKRLRAAVHQLTEPMPGRPAALRARLVHYQVDSWRSPDDFTLLVTLDLHFPPQTALAWNEGSNGRFVHFSRGPHSQTYQLEWATSR